MDWSKIRLRFKRGTEAQLPLLDTGEPGFTTDTKKVFIGAGTENIEILRREDLGVVTRQIEQVQLEKASNSEVRRLEREKANQSFVDAQFASIVSGAPKATFATYAVLKASYPSGTDGTMLVLENGHWYYWNDEVTDWLSGGVYQSTGIADDTVDIKLMKDEYAKLETIGELIYGSVNYVTGQITTGGTNRVRSGYIPIFKGSYIDNKHPNIKMWATWYNPNNPTQFTYLGEIQQKTRVELDGVLVLAFGKNNDTDITTTEKNQLASITIIEQAAIQQHKQLVQLKELSGSHFEWLQGSINGETGVHVLGETTRITSEFIPVYIGDRVQLKNTTDFKLGVRVYSLDKNYNPTSSFGFNEKLTFVATQECFIRLVYAKQDDSEITPTETGRSHIQLERYHVHHQMENVRKQVNNSLAWYGDAYTFIFGTVNNVTGVPTTGGNNRIRTDYLPVKKGLTIFKPHYGYKLGVLFYDANKVYQSVNSLNYTVEKEWVAPTDGYVIVTCAKRDDSAMLLNEGIEHIIFTHKQTIQQRLHAENAIYQKIESLHQHNGTQYTFVFGSVNANTGAIGSGGDTRIRTEHVKILKGTKIRKTSTNYQLAVICYYLDKTHAGIGNSITFPQNVTWTAPFDCYVVIVWAKVDNTPLSLDDGVEMIETTLPNLVNVMLQQDKTNVGDITKLKELRFDEYEWTLPLYASSLVWVGDELWGLRNSITNDHTTNAPTYRYKITSDNELKHVGGFEHNWGHVNTTDYCAVTDRLITAHGDIGATITQGHTFFIFEQASRMQNMSYVDISEAVVYNLSPLNLNPVTSPAVQAVFGDVNRGKGNIVYILYNDNTKKYVKKLVLGLGEHVLENGTFIQGKTANQVNGTYKVVGTYAYRDNVYTDHECSQDATWYNGKIYEGLGHDGLWYNELTFDLKQGDVIEFPYREQLYDNVGNKVYSVTNGVAIRDNLLFLTWYTNNGIKLVARKLV